MKMGWVYPEESQVTPLPPPLDQPTQTSRRMMSFSPRRTPQSWHLSMTLQSTQPFFGGFFLLPDSADGSELRGTASWPGGAVVSRHKSAKFVPHFGHLTTWFKCSAAILTRHPQSGQLLVGTCG